MFYYGVTETVQNEVKVQKRGFLSMLLGTLCASLLGNLLTGKGTYRAEKGKGGLRAGYDRPSHCAYSRDNLPEHSSTKIKDGHI